MASPYRRVARTALVAVLVAVLVALASTMAAGPASAHGSLSASDPADRAVLDQAPPAVTLTFTEAPEPRLSSVRVTDGTGASFGAGEAEPVEGDPESLRIALQPLPRGLYTVSWRIVSRVDGHLTAGTVTFGVQEPVTSAAVTPPSDASGEPPSNRTVASVAGRVLLYAGIAVLLGVAWTGLALFGPDRRRTLLLLASGGWLASAVGTVAVGLAQRTAAGASTSVFLQTRLGHAALWRVAGLTVAALGLAVAARGRWWRPGIGLAALSTLGIVVAHVEAGHAAASGWPVAVVGLQVAHVVAMAVWLGGLAALLVCLRRQAPDEQAATTARRFSAVAGVAIGILAITGVVRAVDAVNGWGPLWHSGYGRLVLVKAVALVILAVLGARNRFRHVPAAGRSLSGLRRVGSVEVAVAVAVLVVTGLLTTSAPPATAGPGDDDEVVLTASDFGTTLKARLTVSPARPGENRFTLRLADYDSADPVAADRVRARFALAAFPDTGPSTLDLLRQGEGEFAASGPNLSLPGRWRMVVTVVRGADSVELSFDVVARTPPPAVTVAEGPGQPAIVTAALARGRTLQVYADPGRPGPTELHLTFFTAGGTEEAIGNAVVIAGDGDPSTPRRLGPGHFVADVTGPTGEWPVEVAALAATGDYLYAPLKLEMSP